MSPSAAPYEIRLLPAAIRQLRKLDEEDGQQIRAGLREQAARSASLGSRGGKSLKTIRGRHDRFHRLRVGEFRVIFDLVPEDRTLRVHGVVNRRDLDRWLRGR
jgi:mRNA-degrading endonuclease RelE of RelBE toxin-antitoxin system